MKISIICAMDEKRGIGKDGKIPWHIRDDLIKLKRLTKDHVVILGRKTYDSMVFYYNRTGRPMPGRLYLVVTHDKNYKPARENATSAGSVQEAMNKVNEILKQVQDDKEEEVFVIGGQSIFEQAINLADKLYLTIVQGDFDCDTFFPDYSEFKKVVSKESKESEGYKYKFLELER